MLLVKLPGMGICHMWQDLVHMVSTQTLIFGKNYFTEKSVWEIVQTCHT
jgi:hypothetical protein